VTRVILITSAGCCSVEGADRPQQDCHQMVSLNLNTQDGLSQCVHLNIFFTTSTSWVCDLCSLWAVFDLGHVKYLKCKCHPLPSMRVTWQGWHRPNQWSFRKTGTMGTLASQAEIGVWVQALGCFCGDPGVSPLEKFWDCMCKIMQSISFLAGKWVCNAAP